MNKKKYELKLFTLYNKTGMETHFEKMARKGWMPDRIWGLVWVYRRIEPQEVRFTVAYFPSATGEDEETRVEQEMFYDFCARTGWQVICSGNQFHVFCTEEQDPIPIETEPELAVEAIHTSVMRSGIFVGTFAGVMCLNITNLQRMLRGFGAFWADSIEVIVFLLGLVLLLFWAGNLGNYSRWYSRAKAAAEQGEFLAPPNTIKAECVLWGTLLGLCGYLVFTMLEFLQEKGPLTVLGFALATGILSYGVALTKERFNAKAVFMMLLGVLLLVGVSRYTDF